MFSPNFIMPLLFFGDAVIVASCGSRKPLFVVVGVEVKSGVASLIEEPVWIPPFVLLHSENGFLPQIWSPERLFQEAESQEK